jgi:hypothetical protein
MGGPLNACSPARCGMRMDPGTWDASSTVWCTTAGTSTTPPPSAVAPRAQNTSQADALKLVKRVGPFGATGGRRGAGPGRFLQRDAVITA